MSHFRRVSPTWLRHKRAAVIVATAAIVVLGVAAGRWGLLPAWTPAATPNVILITVDTLRADRLSCYGYPRHRTPHFDRLAHEGVLFEHAFCDVPWTTPSMASVMTGHYATVHGVRSSFNRLGPEAVTLAEILQAAGIQTAAIVGSYPLAAVFGFNQGFGLFDDQFSAPLLPDDLPAAAAAAGAVTPVPDRFSDNPVEMQRFLLEKASHDAYRPDHVVSERALRWLHTERREPFFLWLHYFGPHEKPQPARDRQERVRLQMANYDPDVVSADEQVGSVLSALDELQLSERTAVILHADHGQSLGEHYYFGHGVNLYDPTQRVPLLMCLPGGQGAGRRIARMVRNLDLFPTILELMHVGQPAPAAGVSLLPIALASSGNREVEETYVETYLPATWGFARIIDLEKDVRIGYRRLGIRTPRWKLIVNEPVPILDQQQSAPLTDEQRRQYSSTELYDLAADPGETSNVLEAHPEVVAALSEKVWRQQTARTAGAASQLDDASRERLKSLGYPTE